jgi:type IV secretion system protein TrbJ
MRRRIKLGSAFLGALLAGGAIVYTATPVDASVPGMPLFALESTQVLNYIELLEQVAQAIQTTQNTLGIFHQAIIDGINLFDFPSSVIAQELQQLEQEVSNSFGVAYALENMDQQFNATYRPWIVGQQIPYSMQYAGWYNQTLATIQATLTRAGINAASIDSDQAIMMTIQNLVQSPIGNDNAVELGTVISTEMLKQLEKLQFIAASDMQQKAAWQGYTVAKDEASQSAAETGLMHVERSADSVTF